MRTADLFGVRRLKLNLKRLWILGVLSIITLAAIFVVPYLCEMLLTGVPPRPFNSTAWKAPQDIGHGRTERSAMVNSLLRKHDLIGKSTSEVIELLGEPEENAGSLGVGKKWTHVYYLGVERAGYLSLDGEFFALRIDESDRVVEIGIVVN
jgi:hypothetical protein